MSGQRRDGRHGFGVGVTLRTVGGVTGDGNANPDIYVRMDGRWSAATARGKLLRALQDRNDAIRRDYYGEAETVDWIEIQYADGSSQVALPPFVTAHKRWCPVRVEIEPGIVRTGYMTRERNGRAITVGHGASILGIVTNRHAAIIAVRADGVEMECPALGAGGIAPRIRAGVQWLLRTGA